MYAKIYYLQHNGNEWIVDGEIGKSTYPGDWTKQQVCDNYQKGHLYDKNTSESVQKTVTYDK